MGEVRCYNCPAVIDEEDAFLIAVDCQKRVYVCAKCYTSVTNNKMSKDRVIRRDKLRRDRDRR